MVNLQSKMIIKQHINVKNFHRSVTTVIRAQNDTSKTANVIDTIFNRKGDNNIAAI